MTCRALIAALAITIPMTAPVAAPLPQGVDAMIREAAKSEHDLKAVVKVAKSAHPDSTAEIDALVESLKAEAASEREARLARAGIWDAWSGSGQVGISKTTGNTSDTGFIVGLQLAKDGLTFRHKLNAQVDRQTSSGRKTRDRYLAGYQLDYKFNDRLFAFGLFTWDRDTFAGFSRRFSESMGIGYSVIKSDTMQLDVNGGPAFRQTRYVTGRSESTTTARAGLDFLWKLTDNLILTENASVYFTGAYASTTALSAAVSDKVSARVSFDLIHESDVPPGRRATDTATRFSLVYGF
jgi:putative salt-induced outer membrane protein